MKKITIAALFVSCLAVLAIAGNAQRENALPKMVRVAIARDAREVFLAIEGSYAFRDGDTGKVLTRQPRQAKTRVRLLDKGIFVGLDVYPVKKLVIQASRDATILINNHSFRGDITLIRTDDNHLTAVNSINIEDYIKGVMYHEVSHHWPMEALKAQAVAARTYALYSMSNSASKPYDVTNDIYSQVYGGKESERYRTGLAVERTAGEILTFNGKILPAYFHATCGGMTEDAGELWGIDILPLKGVPCMFCQNSPHMHWKKNFRLKDIQDALNRKGLKISLIKDIGIVDRNRSGRINNIKIVDRDGGELIIKGKDFRELMGPNIIRSNNYDITMQGYYVDINGKGWGHGVGLCQWGAFGMAEQQFTYKQILSYYYPSSLLVDYHEFFADQKPAITNSKK